MATDTVQDLIDAAAAASRTGDDRKAADDWQRAAAAAQRAGRKGQALTLALCSVSCLTRAGDYDLAATVLDEIDGRAADFVGLILEPHTADAIAAARVRVENLRAESQAKKVTLTPVAPRAILTVERGAVGRVEPEPREPLTAQEILDRATGLGINAKMDEDGRVLFEEALPQTHGGDPEAESKAAADLVRETLESVGLTLKAWDTGLGVIHGRIAEKPAA